MEFITKIEIEEFDHFVLHHPYCHYMKTSSWANYKASTEHMIPHYVGVKENNQLLATALILEKKDSLTHYFYIPWGFCCDYEDTVLLQFLVNSLKTYATQNHVDFLRSDFNVERVHHELDGTLVDDGFSHEFVTDLLIKAGFQHKGYGYAYNGSWVNRFTLIIDISKPIDEIVSRFEKRKQGHIKSMPSQGLSTRVGTKEDLKYVALFEKHLSVKQGFKPKPISYFEKIIDHLEDKAVIYITELDIPQYLSGIEALLQTKQMRSDKVASEIKQQEYNQGLKWQEQYGNKVVIAAGIFARMNTQAWDLYIYSNKHFPMLRSSDSFHMFAMQDMKEHGVLSYDMVGFSGVVDKNDPYFGLYKYKSSFNPRFVEYIGEFDYIINPKKYQRYKKVTRLKNRVKKKLNSIIYTRKSLD